MSNSKSNNRLKYIVWKGDAKEFEQWVIKYEVLATTKGVNAGFMIKEEDLPEVPSADAEEAITEKYNKKM